MTDRRLHQRFELMGALWGVLELYEAARVRNVSLTGAGLDLPSLVALDSTQTMRLVVNGEVVTVEARVRHARERAGAAAQPCFETGIEFVSPPSSMLHSIEQLGGAEPLTSESDISS